MIAVKCVAIMRISYNLPFLLSLFILVYALVLLIGIEIGINCDGIGKTSIRVRVFRYESSNISVLCVLF